MEQLPSTESLLPSEIEPTIQSALWATIGGLCLAAVGPMSCYMTYFIALPVGAWGAWKAWQVSQVTAPGNNERSLSQIALVGGLMSTMLSAFFVFIMVAVIGVYVAMFVFMIVLGVAGAA